ncbi:MAG: prepilin-type N-terminal cleavage/methylation domain-containing protein [Planctomycetota bacterium]
MWHKPVKAGFTLIELLVVISIIALLIAILLPALSSARKSARQMQNSTQLRGIHQGMFSFSQENKGWYPGIDSNGQPLMGGGTVAHINTAGSTYRTAGFGTNHNRRAAVLFELNYFPPEYLVSPGDAAMSLPDTSIPVGTSNVSNDNYSYAMLELRFTGTGGLWNQTAGTWSPSARGQEWRETVNGQAILFSDRAIRDNFTAGNVTDPNQTDFHSIWTKPGSGQWSGSVQRNDGSVEFSNTPRGFKTQYGKGVSNQDDHLFHDESTGTTHANARLAQQNDTATLSAK